MKKVLACHDRKIMASAGFMLKDVCQFAQENSLTGIEFACGIPGTLGGAVFMNAGAYDGEMSHVVSRVRTVNSTGGVHTYDAPNLGFSYRQSRFQKSQEFVVEVELTLRSGDPKEIQARMDDLMNRRRSKQPLKCTAPAVPSSGRRDTMPGPSSTRQASKASPAAMPRSR